MLAKQAIVVMLPGQQAEAQASPLPDAPWSQRRRFPPDRGVDETSVLDRLAMPVGAGPGGELRGGQDAGAAVRER